MKCVPKKVLIEKVVISSINGWPIFNKKTKLQVQKTKKKKKEKKQGRSEKRAMLKMRKESLHICAYIKHSLLCESLYKKRRDHKSRRVIKKFSNIYER